MSSTLRQATARVVGIFAALAALALAPGASGSTLEAAMAELKKGPRVLLMRHAQTVPGVGDPPGYSLDDPSSQRNLNAVGFAQSERIGAALKAADIRVGKVLISRWHRTRETAEAILAAAGRAAPIEVFEALDNAWDDNSRIDAQAAAIRAEMAAWRGPGVLLMVSHGVTIGPTIGRRPAQGGFFVIAPKADAPGYEIALAATP